MRRYLWAKDDPPGMEYAEVDIDTGGMVATSTAFGTAPVPYRLDLDLIVGADWITCRLAVTASGDSWTRSLVLERDGAAGWTGTANGSGMMPASVDASVPTETVGPAEIPSDVLDVDVQYSPLTNVMPIRRLGLDRAGASGTFVMAWVSAPRRWR